jgi:hypothetical protein
MTDNAGKFPYSHPSALKMYAVCSTEMLYKSTKLYKSEKNNIDKIFWLK